MLGAVVLDSSHFYHISTAFLDKILSIKKEKTKQKKTGNITSSNSILIKHFLFFLGFMS